MAGELIEVLRRSDVLSNLPVEALGPLAESATVSQIAAGQLIFETGATDDTLYLVEAGLVEIRRSSHGDLLVVLRPGQSFGELAAFDRQPRSAAAVARTDCTLVGVSHDSLVEVFERAPGALMATVSNLARSLTEAKEQVTLINRFLEEKVRERTEEVHRAQLEIIHRLGTAAEFRADETGSHVYRMSHYSRVLALAAGLPPEQADELLIAAPMHDVGKIGVPDAVLLKAGKLDEAEWELMQAHTTMGAQILGGSRTPSIQLAERIALEHHERWDGTGYPHGVRGDDILFEARICSIADVFDALTSVRPYKKAWELDAAFHLIDDSRGTHFDPDLASAFLRSQDEIRAIHTASLDGTLGAPTWHAARSIEGRADAAAVEG